MTYTSKIKGYKEWLSHTRFALIVTVEKLAYLSSSHKEALISFLGSNNFKMPPVFSDSKYSAELIYYVFSLPRQ